MIYILKRYFIFGLLLVLTACSTLSKQGAEVAVLTGPIYRSCKAIGTEKFMRNFEHSRNETTGRNWAATRGANNVSIRNINKNDFEAKAYNCPHDEVEDLCEMEDKAVACFDAAKDVESDDMRSEDYFVRAYELYKKGCDLGDKPSCSAAQKLLPKVETHQQLQSAKANCTKNKDGKACLEALAVSYESGKVKESIRFAQLACIYGEERGCGFHRDLISQATSDDRNVSNERAAQIQASAITEAELSRQQHANQVRAQDAFKASMDSMNKSMSDLYRAPAKATTECKPGFGGAVSCTTTGN